MKYLAKLSLCALILFAVAPLARSTETRTENIANCFVVNQMSKSEDARYFVNAVSRCHREYDAVYVMVSFLDATGNRLGDGVWAIYWCRPGRREVHEFGIPHKAQGFERVVLRGITTDAELALR